MPRSGDGISLDYRARIVTLVEALDPLIVVSRRDSEVDHAWLRSLVELVGDVYDLLAANACIDSIDLRDICEEVSSLVANIGANATLERNGMGQTLDLRNAQADCSRIVREIDLCREGWFD